jgi:hypothetical protein
MWEKGGKQFLLHSQILQMKSKVRGSYVCICARAYIVFVVFFTDSFRALIVAGIPRNGIARQG